MGWTEEEWDVKRRLIKCTRGRTSSKLTVEFEPMSFDEYDDTRGTKEAKDQFVVSCIYYDATNKCYITSVEILLLLEYLTNGTFNIEEKNRIRRNLEGFKPLTVSKTKGKTADLYRRIMAYPEPRPRNIDKDIKVFQWDDLELALGKVMRKYV
ncbi:hypothetical protein BT69DRAFT_1264281, partial [Atractiella rhizophila]